MPTAMSALFPKGIRALMVDDDTRFVRKATTLMSALNFDVVSCSSATFALKSLSSTKVSSTKFKGIDVVLAHAGKAAACGFDFRAIVEADLGIPVIYFLPEDHEATGDEADELLSTLEAGTYIMKKPLDLEEVRSRLWTVVAWRKCYLESKARRIVVGDALGGGANRAAAAAALEGAGAGEDNEDRVHYKVVTVRKGKGRKRKGGSSKLGGGSSSSSGGTAGGDLPAAVEQEKEDVVASQQQPAQQKPEEDKKGKKICSEASFKHFHFQRPSERHFFIRTFNVPPYNPKFFSDGAEPSSSNPAAFAGASNGVASAPPPPRPVFLATDPAPAPLRPMYPPMAPASAPPRLVEYSSALPAFPLPAHQQHPPTHNAVFGNVAPPTAHQPHPEAHNIVFGNIAPPAARQHMEQHPAAHNIVFGNIAPPAARQQMQQHPAAHNAVFGNIAPPAVRQQMQQHLAAHNVVFGSIAPQPALQQHQPSAHNVVFGNIAPPAAATTMAAAAATAAYEPQFSHGIGGQLPQDVPSVLMFGPFPYQGPSLPALQQDMDAPTVAGDLFAGGMTGGGGVNVGASAEAAIGAGAYDNNNEVTSFLQPPPVDMYTGMDDPPPVAPQHVGNASSQAFLAKLFNNNFDDCSAGSSDGQALDMARYVDELATMAGGGAFCGTNVAAATAAAAASSFMAPQDLDATPDAGNNNYASFMAPQQDLGATPNGGDQLATMAGGGAFGSTSIAAAASFMAPQDLGAAPDAGSSNYASFMAPQDLDTAPNDGSTYAASFMAPQQDLDATVPNDGSNDAAPFMAHQDLSVVANNGGDQLAPNNDNNYGSFMGSQVEDPVTGMDMDDNTFFPLEALTEDGRFPLFDFSMDLDAQLGDDSGSTGGGATNAAGSSLTDGEVGDNVDDNFDIGDLSGLEIPDDLFPELNKNRGE